METNVFSREDNYATEACGWHDTRTPLKVVCGRMQLANFRVFCKTTEVLCVWSNKYLTYTVVIGEGGLYWFISNHSRMRLLCYNITLGRSFWQNYFLLFCIFFRRWYFSSWLSPELSIAWFINATCTNLFPTHMRNNLALANEAHTMIL